MTAYRIDYRPKTRELWADPIRYIVYAIDQHTALFIKTGDIWHKQKAEYLRFYIQELKERIKKDEQNGA